MSRTWLWLEDQPNTTEDIRHLFDKLGLTIETFKTPSELTDFLIKKKKDISFFKNIGFIIDVLMIGTPYIICPQEWCGGDKTDYYSTNGGYDAGLLFYEKLIIERRSSEILELPPPAIFLTILHTSFSDVENRLNILKDNWAKEYKITLDNAKIAWVRKWDAKEDLIKVFEKWREL